MSLLARCSDCSKTYRVPHDRKEWHCKVCSSVLELVEEPAEPAAAGGGEECPACGALFFGTEAFCEECGAELPRADAGTPHRSRPRADEKQAAAEMRRAFKKLRTLKMFLSINLALAIVGGAMLLVFVVLAELPLQFKLLLLGIQAVSIAIAWIAVRQVERNPFPLVLTLAGLQTLTAIWNWSEGASYVAPAVWAALLWVLSVDAAQVARLSKRYPDLYLSKRLRGEHLEHKGKLARGDSVSARRQAKRRERASEERRQTILIWTLVILGLGGGGYGLKNMGSDDQPVEASEQKTVDAPELPSPDDTIEEFRLAWNAADLPAIVELTKVSLQTKMERSLDSIIMRYDWDAGLPQLDDARWDEPLGSSLRVYYTGEAGEFPVRFEGVDGRWVVRTLKTSGMKDWRPE